MKLLNKLRWERILLVIVILVFAGWFLFGSPKSGNDSNYSGEVNQVAYQAVFLTNGQVYFGKLADKEKPIMVLTDIYYLKQGDALQNQDNTSSQDLKLIKFGKELHGPTDKMEIPRENILFIEDLADGSNVAKAIEEHKAFKEIF